MELISIERTCSRETKITANIGLSNQVRSKIICSRFELRTRNSIRGFVRPLVRPSGRPSVRQHESKSGKTKVLDIFWGMCVGGMAWGMDRGWMPPPTRL